MTADTTPPPPSGVVLIVEDDADTRHMLATCLELQGYDVLTAANGREALDCLETRTPTLLLVDLMMPVMDGMEFRDAQRRHPRASAVPFVVFTAVAHGRQIAERIGADGFLPKPVQLNELFEVVSRFSPPAA